MTGPLFGTTDIRDCGKPSGIARFDGEKLENERRLILPEEMNRPPPYFPQNQLSPPDEGRYRKFKLIVAAIAFLLVLLLAGLGFGIYYLVSSLL